MDSFRLEAKVVERNFYVDDLFKSVPSLLEACNLQAGLVKFLALGGFNLTKWISNDKDFLMQSLRKNEHSQCEVL